MRGFRLTSGNALRLIVATASVATVASIGVGQAAASTRSSAGGQAVAKPFVDSAKGSICLFLPNLVEPGWVPFSETGEKLFKQYFPNMTLYTYNGNNSASTQLGQVQACISHKPTFADISPPVPTEAGAALKVLAAAHVPTIGQDNDPDGGPVYAYVWVDFLQVGQYFGRYMAANVARQVGHTPVRLAEVLGDPTFAVYNDFMDGVTPYLNALVKKGVVKIVCKFNTPGWDPTTAQTSMEQCLTKTGNGVDAILGMNDSVMDGASAALETQHLLGKVKMYGGHDSDLTTLQRILAGDQYATFHPINAAQFLDTITLAEAAIAGKTAASTGLIDYHFHNGFVKGGVPTVRAAEQVVTATNMQQTIVDEGLYTKKELCTSIAVSSTFCKG